ncbi:MAG: hypothetical protein QOI78_2912 [Actinomycetota bacterium]|nr:hypothetical protein [Actinomycetota bacterium]
MDPVPVSATTERCACVMNGSVRNPASMSPCRNAAGVFGNSSGTHLIPDASTRWSARTDFVGVSAIAAHLLFATKNGV